jgi:hypothetical protein
MGSGYLNNVLTEVDVLICKHWFDGTNTDVLHQVNNRFKVSYTVRKSGTESAYLKGVGGLAVFSTIADGNTVKPPSIYNDRILGTSPQIKGFQEVCVVGALLPSSNVSHHDFLHVLCDLF